MTLEEIRGLLEKATPGPWRAAFEPYRAGHDITAGARLIAAIPTSMYAHDCHNGYLIAAAPELAALLVRAVEALEASRKGHDHRTISTKCPACLGADQARSLLRELGVGE